MKSRTLNSIRNIIWAVIYKLIIIVLPFVVRTVMIYQLGAQYTGLSSLFTSVLTMLSLAELGFSNAMVYCMYEPIHNGENKTICALLGLYRKIYYIIGSVILVIGGVLLPFLKYFIHGTVPTDINIYFLYLIYLANTVISYFMFAYKSSLLTAYQRNDIISIIGLFCNIVLYVLQIIVLLITKNFYLYAILLPISTVVINLFYEIATKKLFPDIKCYGTVDKELKAKIKKRVIGIMLYKFSSTTRTSFDSIIISSFLGLILLTQYQNYFMIISSVSGILTIISTSITASVGDSIVAKSVDENYCDFRKFVFIYMWIAGWCTACIAGLLQPFMKIWVGKQLLLDGLMAGLFCLYFYAQCMGDMVFLYRTAAGLWWQDRIRPVVEALANIALNFLFVVLWGIHGVIFATIVTLIGINFLWGAKILFKYYFQRGMKEYLGMQIRQAIGTSLATTITVLVCVMMPMEGYINLLLRVIVCIFIPNIVFYLEYLKTDNFKESKQFAIGILKMVKVKVKNK